MHITSPTKYTFGHIVLIVNANETNISRKTQAVAEVLNNPKMIN